MPRLDSLCALAGVAAGLGAAALLTITRQRLLTRGTVAGAVSAMLALAAYPIALTAMPGSRPAPPDARNPEYLGRALPAAAVVVTDEPWAVAWYADRTAIWLPEALIPVPKTSANAQPTEEQVRGLVDATQASGFAALGRADARADAIYLTSGLASYSEADRLGRWQILHSYIFNEVAAAQRPDSAEPPWVPPGWELSATLPPRDLLLVRVGLMAGPQQGEPAQRKAR
jgi:hypothetical protein